MKKKYLIILLAILILITGCQKKEEEKDTLNDSAQNQTTETQNDSSNQNQNQENTNENTEPKEELTNKEEAKKPEKEEAKKPATEETKNPEKSCISKKFSNTYSYVYESYDVCRKKGNQAFLDVTDNKNPNIFAYDCEKIVDDCGKTWYGVIFYDYDYDKHTEVKKYY